VPRAALQLVLEHIETARDPGARDSPWYLLAELSSSDAAPLEPLLEEMLEAALSRGIASDAVIARSLEQAANLWRIRESVPEAQRRAGGSLKHDVAVPVASVAQLIEQGATLVEQLVPEGYLVAYGHAGDGNLHFNVNQKPGTASADFLSREAPLKRAIHDLVAELGGSISAEHGIGQLKVQELARYAPPAKLAAMRAIKQALDSRGILNPGKLLPAP
jgi:FAD/FMN-containing dehydrogenase